MSSPATSVRVAMWDYWGRSPSNPTTLSDAEGRNIR